jgi:hypothetical protein
LLNMSEQNRPTRRRNFLMALIAYEATMAATLNAPSIRNFALGRVAGKTVSDINGLAGTEHLCSPVTHVTGRDNLCGV